jgi:hypothetical protein
MFYAIRFEGNGTAASRLEYSDRQDQLPPGQVACSRVQYDNHTAYKLVNGEIVLHDGATLLQQAKDAKIAAIKAACVAEFEKLPEVCMPGGWLARCDEILARRVALIERAAASADIDAVKAVTW